MLYMKHLYNNKLCRSNTTINSWIYCICNLVQRQIHYVDTKNNKYIHDVYVAKRDNIARIRQNDVGKHGDTNASKND